MAINSDPFEFNGKCLTRGNRQPNKCVSTAGADIGVHIGVNSRHVSLVPRNATNRPAAKAPRLPDFDLDRITTDPLFPEIIKTTFVVTNNRNIALSINLAVYVTRGRFFKKENEKSQSSRTEL